MIDVMKLLQVTSLAYLIPYWLTLHEPRLVMLHKSVGLLVVTSQAHHGYGALTTLHTVVGHALTVYLLAALPHCPAAAASVPAQVAWASLAYSAFAASVVLPYACTDNHVRCKMLQAARHLAGALAASLYVVIATTSPI